MKGFVGVTDNDSFAFLSQQPVVVIGDVHKIISFSKLEH